MLEGRTLEGLDVLTQRWKALEVSTREGSWENAEEYEG